jgi:hypothetical protein
LFWCLRRGPRNREDFTGADTWRKQDLQRLIPPFTYQELIDWISTCNAEGGVCTSARAGSGATGQIPSFRQSSR